jgi:release factor glutamine methyltransferase
VEVALDRTRTRHMFGRALDLCTGSGCVAIAFFSHRRTWQVTGTDVSPEAIELARENAMRLGAIWGIRFVSGDLFSAIGDRERFELVTANPPYVPSLELAQLERGIRDHEPRLALDGGADGLSLVRTIVGAARARLVPGGVLALEVGAGQADEVARSLEQAGYVEIERRRDYGGHERVVSGRTR